jgi:hypothetical protein
VDKPALLRRLFELAYRCSRQVLSYTKMLGQLQDAGNSTTLAHHLNLLAGGKVSDSDLDYIGIVEEEAGVDAVNGLQLRYLHITGRNLNAYV